MTYIASTGSPSVRMVLRLALATALPGAMLAGCTSNPFRLEERDYARAMAMERLRSLTPMTLNPAPAAATPAQAASSQVPDRLAGLATAALTLEEARARTLEHNLEIRVAVVDPAIARERLSEEEARFEAVLGATAIIADSDQPSLSELDSNQSSSQRFTPSIRVPTVTGGSVELSAPVSRTETDNRFSLLNVQHSTDLEFSISHPLLRGAGRRITTSGLRLAGYQGQASEARTRLEIIRQLTATDRAYWSLYQATRELDVRKQQLDLAQAQLDRARRRVAAGAAAEIEITRAEAGLADRVEAVIVAQNTILLRQRDLKRVMNAPGLDVDSTTLLTPATDPDPIEFTLDEPTLMAAALEQRSELIELELQLAADAVQQGLDRDALLPLVNLTYTYRLNGAGASIGDSLDVLTEADFPDWTLALTAEMPLGNEAAKSRLRQTILRRIARLSTKAERERAIRQEVLNSVDALRAGWQRILAARQSVVLNTRALRAEQRQFDVGNSTSTNVLDSATRLAESQLAEIRAITDYQTAQADLAFASGTVLGMAKVSWAPAPSPSTDQPDPQEWPVR